MHFEHLHLWRHDHTFGQDRPVAGERGTRVVMGLTAATMVVEIAGGMVFGSMALLADGLHMASHAVALGIAVAVYAYVRRHAGDDRFSFGVGKVNALGGFASAVLLAGFAAVMALESLNRLIAPEPIDFGWAIGVAAVGLAVNGLSVLILGEHGHHHGHAHDHDHDHDHDHNHGRADHNLRAARLHVLADALTSVLAIAALLAGDLFGAVWLDPAVGIAGAVLVGRWAWALAADTGAVLVDRQAPAALRERVRRAIEADADNRVADLHLWVVGPDRYAAAISVVSHQPRPPEHYKALLPGEAGIAHATIEVHRCPGPH